MSSPITTRSTPKTAIIDIIPTAVTYERMAGANDTIMDDMAVSPFPDLPKPPELHTLALAKLLRYQKLMETFFNAIRQELLSRAISDEEELLWVEDRVGPHPPQMGRG
jgi:hypothetical protein